MLSSPAHTGPPTLPPGERFAVVDVETSGLDPVRHRILQVAVVTVEDGVPTESWVSTVRPGWHRVRGKEIHGLRRRDLRHAPAFAALAPELEARLSGATVVAHNAPFDLAFLRRAFEREGLAPPAEPWLCTVEISRSLDPDRQLSHRLPDVCARYGVTIEHAHDALGDATATALVLPHLLAASGIESTDALATAVHTAPPMWRGPRRRRRWRRRQAR